MIFVLSISMLFVLYFVQLDDKCYYIYYSETCKPKFTLSP